MINIKKVSQINTILDDAEKKVKKIKHIPKNEPIAGPALQLFEKIKKKLLAK